MRTALTCLTLILGALSATASTAATICTLLEDAPTGNTLLEQGDCTTRVTPASTFKIPLAVMAFDAGLLTDAARPVMSFRPGEPDWGGAMWTRDTTPSDWMRYSVLWYSQRLTHAMGAETLARYTRSFGYGNADITGDPGFDNGLDRSWIASSLKISPQEQAAFLHALLRDSLPVTPAAMSHTRALLDTQTAAGWTLRGKTGTAYPRRADRSFDDARGWGWYVGWATRDDRSVIVVRLTQSDTRTPTSPGILTRDSLLQDWASLAPQ
ncbi:MAG: class D beta-lactamase [Rhodobacterales bacterium 34-62-10]|nr:MAG: class D beta-lactamase [Rhodobacterales bacterium 34-62-10]